MARGASHGAARIACLLEPVNRNDFLSAMILRASATGAGFVLPFIVFMASMAVARGDELATALRRPVALAASADGTLVYAANRDSGSISTINVATQKVIAEQTVGRQLSDLVCLPNSSRLLATDESSHEVIV